MKSIVPIVEGKGEIEAVPVLVRRILHERLGAFTVHVSKPVRIQRNRIRSESELSRASDLAKTRPGGCDALLVVCDADDDCPVELADAVRELLSPRDLPIGCAIADREYEAWLLSGISGMRGQKGIGGDAVPPPNATTVRDAKRALGAMMSGRSSLPTVDQAAFSSTVALQQAEENSRSFRSFPNEVERLADVLANSGDASDS